MTDGGQTTSTPGANARPDLLAFLRDIPNLIKVLDVAVSAILALLVSRLLMPEQLEFLRTSAYGLAVLGVLASWVWHRSLRKRIGIVIAIAALLLIAILIMDQRYVRDVSLGSPPDVHHYLVGEELSETGRLVAAQLGGIVSDVEIIRETGADMIPQLWADYETVSTAYTVVFCAFVFVGVLALSAGLSTTIVRT